MSVTPTQTVQVPPIPVASPTLSPALMRRVFGMLEEHFDGVSGQYAAGWSDRKISETANVPMVHVSRIREEAFGPIKADPELQAIRAEQERISKAMEKLMDDHYAVGKRIEAYASKMGVK